MAARKNRPVLYEIVRRGERQRKESWPTRVARSLKPTFRRDESDPASTPDNAPPEPLQDAARPTPPPPSPPPPSPVVAPRTAAPDDRAPAVRVSEAGLVVSLSWWMAGVIGVGLLLLLAVTFQFGTRWAADVSTPPGDATTSVQNDGDLHQPSLGEADAPPIPRPGVNSFAGDSPAVPPKPAGTAAPPAEPAVGQPPRTGVPQAELRDGYHYIVVQYFPKRRLSDAQEAARFLQENGIPTALRSGADHMLVVDQAFLIDQDERAAGQRARARATQLVAQVKQLGQEFNKQRGYDFRDAKLEKF